MAIAFRASSKDATRNAKTKEKMMNAKFLNQLRMSLPPETTLVAVSKFHSTEAIIEAYNCGQRCFAESRPQELFAKVKELPKDISWHFIGHLQTNKLKMVLPYTDLVESVDSLRLLESINKWGSVNNKIINILLEYYLSKEDTKQGFSEEEIREILEVSENYPFIKFCGLMAMASNTDDEQIIDSEFSHISMLFKKLQADYNKLKDFNSLSIGMSNDYKIALRYKPKYIRIGSLIFGPREY